MSSKLSASATHQSTREPSSGSWPASSAERSHSPTHHRVRPTKRRHISRRKLDRRLAGPNHLRAFREGHTNHLRRGSRAEGAVQARRPVARGCFQTSRRSRARRSTQDGRSGPLSSAPGHETSQKTRFEVRRGERFRIAQRKQAYADPRSACLDVVQLDSLARMGRDDRV